MQFIVSLRLLKLIQHATAALLILDHTLRFQWQVETTNYRLFLFHR